jgi:zinc D-Ala-D-Ala carboxypeptidase
MPSLDFARDFTRVIGGDLTPPDPFVDMGGILDDWWTDTFVTERESVADQKDDFSEPLSRARSWDKQVEDILGPGRGSVGRDQGREPSEFDTQIPREFSLQAWQQQYENAQIPASAMAKVPGTGFLMEPHAAKALGAMFDAAREAGLNLSIGNTYRDMATQGRLYQAHLSGDHPAPVARPGTSNHGWGLAVDINAVDDREFQWLLRNAASYGFTNPWIEGKSDTSSVEPWHWEYGGGGDQGPIMSPTRQPSKHDPGQGQPTYAPLVMVDDLVTGGTPAFGTVLASLLQPVTGQTPRAPRSPSSTTGKPRGGSVKAQLRSGFMDAGRPDLAKMVNTRDFDTWIKAESGWNVSSVSKYFPGHGRNYGLFQFWQGHTWTDNYLSGETDWTADAYTQAKLVARYFSHLTPDDIRRYAAQIRNGSYQGWG